MPMNGKACGACASWSKARSSSGARGPKGPSQPGWRGRTCLFAAIVSSRAPAGLRRRPGRVLPRSIGRPAASAFRRVIARTKHRYEERTAVDSQHKHSHEEAHRLSALFRRTEVGQPGLRISKQQSLYVYSVSPPPHSTSLTRKQASPRHAPLRPWTETVITLPPRIVALVAARIALSLQHRTMRRAPIFSEDPSSNN